MVSEKRGELSSLQNERSRNLNNREIRDYEEELHRNNNVIFATTTPRAYSNMQHDSKDSSLDEYLKSITPQPNTWSNSVRQTNENEDVYSNIVQKDISYNDNNINNNDNAVMGKIMGYGHSGKKLSTSALRVSARADGREDARHILNSESDSDDGHNTHRNTRTGDMSSDDEGVMESNRSVTRMKIQQLTAKFSS